MNLLHTYKFILRNGALVTGFASRAFRDMRRRMSAGVSLVMTEYDTSREIATLTMNNLPVNSLSLSMCEDLVQAIDEAESRPKTKGLILKSSSPTVFSAGIDLSELHKPDPERLVRFWKSFQDVYLKLYGCRLGCVAMIEGHAIAGGCMLALCCDYRIMSTNSDKHRISIGLNESKLGIAAPHWLVNLMIDTVGQRRAEISLQLGHLYSPEEALGIGLVDEVVAKEAIRERSEKVACELAKIPAKARFESKMLVRRSRLDALLSRRQQDTDFFTGFVHDDGVQKSLTEYLDNLSTTSSRKKSKE